MTLSSFVRSRVLALPLCLGLSLAACGDDSGGGEPEPTKDAGNNKTDSGTRNDASTPRDDGGPTIPDSGQRDASSGDPKLDALAGRYMMRWDVVGTASSKTPLGDPLTIRSRLSTLVIAELSVRDGKLMSNERVCTQVADQKCKEGCTKATTVVDSRTINNFLIKKNQTREFTLGGDTLTAGHSVAQLGYDDADLETAAPTSNSDQRVWDVDPSTPAREGFLTKISATVTTPLGGVPYFCDAFGTQKFVSTFSATLGSDGKLSFEPDNLNLDGSQAPVLGSSDPNCDSQAMMAMTPIDKHDAYMVRYGDDLSADVFWACPSNSEFDKALPPTEPNLDGP